MIPHEYRELTFKKLDEREGVVYDTPVDRTNGFPLEVWYWSVRETPFADLSILDYSRACEQDIHREAVVPVAIELLREDILAGDWFEGQLLQALINIPKEFWPKHVDIAYRLRELLEAEQPMLEGDPAVEVRALLDRIAGT